MLNNTRHMHLISLLAILLVTILLSNAGNNYNHHFIERANARLPAYEGRSDLT